MNNFTTGWLASEDAAQDVIHLKRIYIKINDDNLYDGVMFSQIMFWHGRNKETGKPRMKIKKQGHLWLAKKYSDWEDECGINEHTARKCINRIKKRGLIFANLWKFDNVPMVHIRINWDEFEKRIMSNRPERSNPGIDLRGQVKMTLEVNSITETTSKTTTENKDIAANAATPPLPKQIEQPKSRLNGNQPNGHVNGSSLGKDSPPPGSGVPPSPKDVKPYDVYEALVKIESGITKGHVLKEAEAMLNGDESKNISPCTLDQIVRYAKFLQSKNYYIKHMIPVNASAIRKGIYLWRDAGEPETEAMHLNGNGRIDDIDNEWQAIKIAAAQPGRPNISERALIAIQTHVPGGWRTFKEQDARFFDQLKPVFKEAYERANQQPATA